MTASVTTDFAAPWAAADEGKQIRQSIRYVPARDLPADQERYEQDALKRIRTHLERYGLRPPVLAGALRVLPRVVSMLVAEPSKIPARERAEFIARAEQWVAADARARELQAARIIPTQVTRLLVGAARAARELKIIALVIGGPGLGKSYGLEAVRAELPGQTVIARADPQARGVKGLLRLLGSAASTGSATAVLGRVKAGLDLLGGTGLVVVDEVQIVSTLGLEAARALFDEGNLGLLLVGTTAVRRTLNPAIDPLVGPLVSRVGLVVDLDANLLSPGPNGEARPWIDAATVQAIVGRHVAQPIEPSGLARLVEAANAFPGHLRTAVNAGKLAGFLARRRTKVGDATVTENDISEALGLRLADGLDGYR